jgi:hypothetical protein
MQLSADVPWGLKAIEEHLASGQSLSMNVSPDADRAFQFELRKDVKRWANLEAAVFRDF